MRPIGYFEAEIKTDDSKFETSVFVINDNSIDMIIDTDVMQQGALTISGNDVKINKCHNDSKISLVNFIKASEVTVNSKFFNLYSSTFQSSNSRVLN